MSSNLCLCVSLSQSHTCSNYGFPFGLKSSNVVLDPIDLHYMEKTKQKNIFSSFYSLQVSLSVIFLNKMEGQNPAHCIQYTVFHTVCTACTPGNFAKVMQRNSQKFAFCDYMYMTVCHLENTLCVRIFIHHSSNLSAISLPFVFMLMIVWIW